MSAQAVFGWWRKAVETEWDQPRLIGCNEGIFRAKTTHQQGNRNLHGWQSPLKFLTAQKLQMSDTRELPGHHPANGHFGGRP